MNVFILTPVYSSPKTFLGAGLSTFFLSDSIGWKGLLAFHRACLSTLLYKSAGQKALPTMMTQTYTNLVEFPNAS